MAYEREAQTDIADLKRQAAALTEAATPAGYEREAQSDVRQLQRLVLSLPDADSFGGYERVGQTDVAALRRKLRSGGGPILATGYSLSGPIMGAVGTPSAPFTVTLTPSGGAVTGTVTVTPSDSGGGGTFTPSTVALITGSPSATFTYTPASSGVKTISTTNNGGLANPSSATYTVSSTLNDGDPVSTWADSSGSGNNATQTGSSRPIFKTNILNGKPVVRFSTAGTSGLNISTISGAGSFTCFAVMKATGSTSNLPAMSGSLSPGPKVCYEAGDGNVYVANRAAGGNTSATVAYGAFHVLTSNMNGTTPSIWMDGASQGMTPGGAANTDNFTVIGWLPAFPAYGDGDIAEIIFYNVLLSSTDRANIEKYLGTKYGITVAGGTAVDPSTVAGLVGWWKADSLAPVVPGLNDGDPVTTWADSSGNGHTATQTGTARPTFKTAIVNGKPIVRFTSAGLSNLTLASTIPGTNPTCCFVVMKMTGSSIVSISGNTGGASGPFISGGVSYASNNAGYLAYAGIPGAGFHVLTANLNAGIETRLWFDGTDTVAGQNVNPTSEVLSVIGAQGSLYSDGDIAEIIFYNRFLTNATDRVNIEKYLGTKYGITVAGGSAVDPTSVAGLTGWWKADSLG